MNPYMRVSDVARLLGLSRQRVYQMTQEHKLPFVRIGRSVRIPQTAWDMWLKAQHDEAVANMSKGEVSANVT